jgi:hypothetical protein
MNNEPDNIINYDVWEAAWKQWADQISFTVTAQFPIEDEGYQGGADGSWHSC